MGIPNRGVKPREPPFRRVSRFLSPRTGRLEPSNGTKLAAPSPASHAGGGAVSSRGQTTRVCGPRAPPSPGREEGRKPPKKGSLVRGKQRKPADRSREDHHRRPGPPGRLGRRLSDIPGRGEVRRQCDQRTRGPRGGAQASRHVHRLDRRAGPAPPRLRSGGQRGRRGPGRLLRPHRGDPAGRRRSQRRGQRPRHPGGHRARPGEARRRGRAHRAARGRQVRRRRLRGLRRSARRRRVRGQRPVQPADRRGQGRRVPVDAGLPARRADRGAGQGRGGVRDRHDRRPSGRTTRSSRPPRTTSRPSPGASRRWPSSTGA